MKQISLFFILSFFLLSQLSAQLPWARQSMPYDLGGSMTPKDISIDPWGNTYMFANFTGNVQVGDFQLEDFNKVDEIGPLVLVKYNAEGHVNWAKPISGKASSQAYGVANDSEGNVYICGEYDQTNDFTKIIFGDGVELEGNPSSSVFIAKADSSGTFQWARRILATDDIGNQFISPKDIEVDASGNVYMTGSVLQPVNIDNQTYNQNNGDKIQMFIAKYNTEGDFEWFKHTDKMGEFGSAEGTNLRIASNGNIAVTGTYWSAVSWAGDSLAFIPFLNNNLFVGSFSPEGNLNWWQSVASAGSASQSPHELGIDSQGNVYVVFRAAGQVSLLDTTFFLQSDRYLFKINSSGNREFVKPLYSQPNTIPTTTQSLFTRANGWTYVVGTYGFTSPLFGDQTLPPDPNGFNVRYYLALYDDQGNIQSARSLFDEYISQFYEVNIATILENPEGELLITGHFEGDMSLGMDTISSMGFQDQGLLLKIDPQSFLNSTTNVENLEITDENFSVYPNPASKGQEIMVQQSLDSRVKLSLLDLSGKVLNRWENIGETHKISMKGLPSGIYLLNIEHQGNSLYRKIIIQ